MIVASSSKRKWYHVSTAPQRDPVLHEYFDKVQGHYVCIQERKLQLSLARVFGELVLFWRFSLDGRIRNVSFKIGNTYVYPLGISVYKKDREDFWSKGFAFYHAPPLESAAIFTRTAHLSPLDQYKDLLSKMQGEMLAYLASPSLPDCDIQRRPYQLPLRELFSNPRACSSLERAVRLNPHFRPVNERVSIIMYSSDEDSFVASSSLFEQRKV